MVTQPAWSLTMSTLLTALLVFCADAADAASRLIVTPEKRPTPAGGSQRIAPRHAGG